MADQLVDTELWEHQRNEIARFEDQARVLIAWDMGTGKTLAAVERDLRLRRDAYEGPTLVIAPINTHESWRDTYRNESDLVVKTINRKQRDWFVGEKGSKADVYIMHYEALRLMPELRDAGFGHVIGDECHKIKNRKSKQTKAIKKLAIPYITDMSGSPVTDHPDDLWSILNHLKPRTYSAYWPFFEKAVDYKTGFHGYKEIIGPSHWWRTAGLAGIHDFYSRKLQDECLDLPGKLYNQVHVDLARAQRRIYNEMRDDMITWINSLEEGEEALHAPVIIAQMIRLQQIACATPEFGTEGKIRMTEPSSKADAVMAIMEDNPDEQFVIFSQFKGPLRILKQRFEKDGTTYASFTGDDHQRIRESGKREFIAGNRRVLLGTIGSGGVGVDGLQHASCNVIFIDRNWSPMLNKQAEDRLNRGGQTRVVNIYDVIARDTIDLGRLQRIELKAHWIKQMLGDK